MSENIVKNGNQALKEYKKTGTMPDIKSLVKENNDYGVLKCIFEDYLDVWTQISIVEAKEIVDESLAAYEKDYDDGFPSATISKESAQEAMVSTNAMLARVIIDQYSLYRLDESSFKGRKRQRWNKMYQTLRPQVIKLWLDAFGEKPGFIEKLKDNFKRYGGHEIPSEIK